MERGQSRMQRLISARKKATIAVSLDDSFERIAEVYIAKKAKKGMVESTLAKTRSFLSLLNPATGGMVISGG